jgi:cell shape-determining protein MreD
MKTSRYALTAVLLIWICAGMQQGIASKLSVFGAPPDYLLVGACILGLLTETRIALIIGFCVGVAHSAIVGESMWQYVVTRMLAAWLCAFLVESRFQRNFGSAAVTTLGCTLVSGLVFMIIAPQPNIAGTLTATIIKAVYNGVLAMVVYIPIERAAGVRSQQL